MEQRKGFAFHAARSFRARAPSWPHHFFRRQPRLPVKQRTVIILYYYNEMTIKEIAAACRCLEGTVKSRLFHGKARLKEALTKQDQKGGATWTILS